MINDTERRLSTEILNPILRLLGLYEISNFYNYLPGKDEDSYDCAWGLYYNKLNEIYEKIRMNTYLTKDLTKFLMNIYEDIELLISEEGGFDRLSKQWYMAEHVDVEEINKEAELRLSVLEKKRGTFRRTKRFDEEAKRLIDNEKFYTYHIIKEPDASYYLGVETSKLYWRNHRSDRFVQCYRVTCDTEVFKVVPVEVRDGELRICEGWL